MRVSQSEHYFDYIYFNQYKGNIKQKREEINDDCAIKVC